MDAGLLGRVHLLSLKMFLVGYNPSGDPRSIKATVRTDPNFDMNSETVHADISG
jgi:hypothetical protein